MKGKDTSLVLLRGVSPEEEDEIEVEEATLTEWIRDELEDAEGWVSAHVRLSSSVVDGIVSEAEVGYDLLVMGASEESFLAHWLFSPVPDVMAERVPCSVLLVRKHEPSSVSWVWRIARRMYGRKGSLFNEPIGRGRGCDRASLRD